MSYNFDFQVLMDFRKSNDDINPKNGKPEIT